MEFHARFQNAVAKINNRRLSEHQIQQALGRYNGRSLVFRVRNDATYVFYISNNGIKYEVNPTVVPNDMYVEMDLGRARKLVYYKSLGIFDIPFIVYRNITLADVEFAKRIFGGR